MISPQQIETVQWVDTAIRIIGWPTVLGIVVWVVRKWDAGQRELKELHVNGRVAVETMNLVKAEVDTIKNNHLAHLQTGIEQLAGSNDKAVEVLQDIKAGIGILVDRTPRKG
jgi:hypothetical protein